MRLALITPALCVLAACGGQPDDAGPERRSAAGKVLGGEVTDDMLPLDTARSTSPPDPRAGTPGDRATPTPARAQRKPLPEPEVSGGPQPHTPAPPGVDPTDGPPRE